jgi:hypothetical protein
VKIKVIVRKYALVVFSFFFLVGVSGCGSNSSTSQASSNFKNYVISQSSELSNYWDSSIQPLLASADSSQASMRELSVAFADFGLLADKISDGIPSDPGEYKENSKFFSEILGEFITNSPDAWMALVASDPSELQTALDNINNAFVKLTVLVKRFTNP